jgi:hypothetical protein
LAKLQWEYGQLDDRVKARALKLIDSGVALKRWTQRTLDARRHAPATCAGQVARPTLFSATGSQEDSD